MAHRHHDDSGHAGGPSGGAAAVCSGEHVRRPYTEGTLRTPIPGVHLTATPTTSGRVPFAAAPVGVAWDTETDEMPPSLVLTLTNDGTQPLTGISEWSAAPCGSDLGPWGRFQRVHTAASPPQYTADPDDVELPDACTSTIAAGDSCSVMLTMWDATTRGGADLPGWLRIGVTTAAGGGYPFYLPISTSSTSQGHWDLTPVRDLGHPRGDLRTFARLTTTYRATNIGDQDAVATFETTGSLAWQVVSRDSWTPDPDEGETDPVCPKVTTGSGGEITIGALPPGSSCLVRVTVCTATAGTIDGRLWGRATGTARDSDGSARLGPLTVRHSTPEEPNQCAA